MRVELADDITHGSRGFLVLGCCAQPQFTHRINNSALNRLESVADERKRAIEHNIHGIVEIGFLGIVLEWHLLVIAKT